MIRKIIIKTVITSIFILKTIISGIGGSLIGSYIEPIFSLHELNQNSAMIKEGKGFNLYLLDAEYAKDTLMTQINMKELVKITYFSPCLV